MTRLAFGKRGVHWQFFFEPLKVSGKDERNIQDIVTRAVSSSHVYRGRPQRRGGPRNISRKLKSTAPSSLARAVCESSGRNGYDLILPFPSMMKPIAEDVFLSRNPPTCTHVIVLRGLLANNFSWFATTKCFVTRTVECGMVAGW